MGTEPILAYTKRQKYVAVVDAFTASCDASGGFVFSSGNADMSFSKGPTGTTEVNWKLHCKDWPERPGSPKRVSILVQVEETVHNENYELLRSTVRVNYLSSSDGNLVLRQAVHLDFDPKPKRDHSIFHAQISDESINLEEHEVQNLSTEPLVVVENHPCLQTARIPTCDMSFVSVLLCLVADHIGEDSFTDFYTKAKQLQKEMPLPQIEALQKSLAQDADNVRSSHWFAHQFAQS